MHSSRSRSQLILAMSSVTKPPPRVMGFHFRFLGADCLSLSTNRSPCSVKERKVVFSFRATRCARSKRSSAISIVVFMIWLPIFT